MDRLRICASLAALPLLLGTPVAREQIGRFGPSFFLDSLTLQTFFLLLAVAGAATRKPSIRQGLALVPTAISPVRLALILLGMLGVSEAVEAAIQLSTGANSGSLGAFADATRGLRGFNLLFGIVSLAVAPAIGEEMLFRGLLQRSLENTLGKSGALVVAALAFGMAHLDPIQAPAATALGLYLGAVLLRTNSLWPAILCHLFNNTLAVLQSAYGTDFGERGPWLIPGGLFLAVMGLYAAKPRNTRDSYSDTSGSPRK